MLQYTRREAPSYVRVMVAHPRRTRSSSSHCFHLVLLQPLSPDNGPDFDRYVYAGNRISAQLLCRNATPICEIISLLPLNSSDSTHQGIQGIHRTNLLQ